MFRLPRSSNQSPSKKGVGIATKNQGVCKYSHRPCHSLCLENYDYCLKHILEDKTAPYKTCPYLYTVSGKKCGKPAYRPDRRETWFCGEHSRKANLARLKASIRHAPPPTPEVLLASLAHYVKPEQSSTVKKGDNENEDTTSKKSSRVINPFVEVDAAAENTRCSQVLDFASDSDSDVEPAMLDNVWRAQDLESSDAESVDSQAEDPLKYAGVYTAEEVTTIIKDKMIRLQSLYIDQFRRLQYLLKEKRRRYLHSLKKEKETLCSIHSQEKSTAKEQKLYQKLKASNHYHKYYGEEAILHKKALERRVQATDGALARKGNKGKCAFTEGGVKCGAKTLPVTKFCRKHILEDTQQVLFRACGAVRDDHTCQEPTLNVFENATCVNHITLPAQPHSFLETIEPQTTVKIEAGPVQSVKEVSFAAETSFMDVDESVIKVQESILKGEKPDLSLLNPEELSKSLLEAADPSLSQIDEIIPPTSKSDDVKSVDSIPSELVTLPSEGIQPPPIDVENMIPNIPTVEPEQTISTGDKQDASKRSPEYPGPLPEHSYSLVQQEPLAVSDKSVTCSEHSYSSREREPADSISPVDKKESNMSERNMTEEDSEITNTKECVDKMDIDTDTTIKLDTEPRKKENLNEEPPAVISDVGVVGEVLGAKVKSGVSMQFDVTDKSNVEHG